MKQTNRGGYINTKKGFTLIELLAVIVILAIIALIAVPMILNYISDSKKGTNQASANHVYDALELYAAKRILDGKTGIEELTFPEDNNILNMNGTKPEGGWALILANGSIDMLIKYDGVCYYQGLYHDTLSESDCFDQSLMIASTDWTITDGVITGYDNSDISTYKYFIEDYLSGIMVYYGLDLADLGDMTVEEALQMLPEPSVDGAIEFMVDQRGNSSTNPYDYVSPALAKDLITLKQHMIDTFGTSPQTSVEVFASAIKTAKNKAPASYYILSNFDNELKTQLPQIAPPWIYKYNHFLVVPGLEQENNVYKTIHTLGTQLSAINETTSYYVAETIYFSEGIRTIGVRALAQSGAREIYLPKSLQTIQNYAFQNTPIKEIVLYNKIDSLGAHLFDSCYNMQTITVKKKEGSITSVDNSWNIIVSGVPINVIYQP